MVGAAGWAPHLWKDWHPGTDVPPSPRFFSYKYGRSNPGRSHAEGMKDRVRAPCSAIQHTQNLHCCNCCISLSAFFSKNATECKPRADQHQVCASRKASRDTVPAAAEAWLRATFGRILNASLPPFWAETAQRVMQQSFLQRRLCCSSSFYSGGVASLGRQRIPGSIHMWTVPEA